MASSDENECEKNIIEQWSQGIVTICCKTMSVKLGQIYTYYRGMAVWEENKCPIYNLEETYMYRIATQRQLEVDRKDNLVIHLPLFLNSKAQHP